MLLQPSRRRALTAAPLLRSTSGWRLTAGAAALEAARSSRRWDGVGAVVALAAAAAAGLDAGECAESGDGLRARLLARLKSVRESRGAAPVVRVARGHVHPENEGERCRISFDVADARMTVAMMGAFSRRMEEGGVRLQVASGKQEEEELGLVFPDGSVSVTRSSFDFFKDGQVSDLELDAFVDAYAKGAFPQEKRQVTFPFRKLPDTIFQDGNASENPSNGDAFKEIERLGAVIYRPGQTQESSLDWSALAGYDQIKQDVEDTVLLGIQHPEEYENITRKTRQRFESNRPRAILFEGPPGVGKTMTARIVAAQASVPMVYIPIESVMSKYYGESESRLSKLLKLCDNLGNAIIFLDEIDSLSTSRDSGGTMHEATRRLLSVLLRTLDGFAERSSSIVIMATNRKQDLDAALMSRFDLSISFPLPKERARVMIFNQYAKHLSTDDLRVLAAESEGFSGRDIKDACKQAERRWVAQKLRRMVPNDAPAEATPPNLAFYIKAVRERRSALFSANFVQQSV